MTTYVRTIAQITFSYRDTAKLGDDEDIVIERAYEELEAVVKKISDALPDGVELMVV